jgi:hypothetical protein
MRPGVMIRDLSHSVQDLKGHIHLHNVQMIIMLDNSNKKFCFVLRKYQYTNLVMRGDDMIARLLIDSNSQIILSVGAIVNEV